MSRPPSWQLTNTDGTIGLRGTLIDQAAVVRSATLTIYAYVDGKPLAIMTTSVTNAPSKTPEAVEFSSSNKWGSGTKILLLVAP